MAKKRANKSTARAKKQTPAMYPTPGDAEWVKLEELSGLLDELDKAGPISHSIERALNLAMDLAKVIQRGQTQIDYGETVNRGKRNAKATAGATEAQHTKKNDRSEAAHTEFLRRMATVKGTRRKTDTLTKMSKEMNGDGQPKYGSLRTLIRYAEHWKSVTPSE